MYDQKGEIVRGINKKIAVKAEPWQGIKTNRFQEYLIYPELYVFLIAHLYNLL